MAPDNKDDELSNSAIALLCEIGEFEPEQASAEQKTHLGELIAGAFITEVPEETDDGHRYKLTGKAMQFLSERGVGLNEG